MEQELQAKKEEFEEEEFADFIVKADNIHKTYLFGLEGVAALRGVSLQIKQGEFVMILGNSGGGKTSLLNILGTIDKLTKVEQEITVGKLIALWGKNQINNI